MGPIQAIAIPIFMGALAKGLWSLAYVMYEIQKAYNVK